jgi:hypothetical protein
MANDLNTVRKALFETLADLRDKDNPMDIERARAISNVSGRILESARVEIDFLRATGRQDSPGTGFVPITVAQEADNDEPPNGILSVRKHLIR